MLLVVGYGTLHQHRLSEAAPYRIPRPLPAAPSLLHTCHCILLLNTYLTRNLCCFCACCLVPCALCLVPSENVYLRGGCDGQGKRVKGRGSRVGDRCDWRRMLRLICFRQAPSQVEPNAAQAVVDASSKRRKCSERERRRMKESERDMDMLYRYVCKGELAKLKFCFNKITRTSMKNCGQKFLHGIRSKKTGKSGKTKRLRGLQKLRNENGSWKAGQKRAA